ncbi:hypothetical protein JCM8208_004612 [Rhodotorula glutinis]
MSPRRSSRVQPPSAQLAPPSRADSSSSSDTNGRRSRSCDSASTDLTPVPEGELKEATTTAGDEPTAPTPDEVDDADQVESDTSFSPRRSARNTGVARPDYALVHDGDFDGARARKRRGSAVSERSNSPVATRSKRRRAHGRSTEVDDAGSATPDPESSRRSPTADEREGTSFKRAEQITATADSSPLTSPPDTSFGSSIAIGTSFPPSASNDLLSGSTAADEVGQAVLPASPSINKPEGKPVLDANEPAQRRQLLDSVDAATECVALRSSRRLAGADPVVPRKKRETPLTAPPPEAWFEVIVRGDAYAAVTATTSGAPREPSPSSSLIPLAIVRHDDFLPRHAFTSYRFPLLISSDEPVRIEDVVVRLEGSRKKMRGPSADEVDGLGGSGRAEGSTMGHWTAVLKGGEYRWMAP